MKFELIIGSDPYELNGTSTNVYLDTFDTESISFNYNITDISDLSSKKSSYSKTINLPDTNNNRLVFTDIFNIESIQNGGSSNFNVSKKVRCYALGDGIIIFKGNLQLTNIVYDYENNKHFYEVVIFADNDTLFKTIGEKYLSDLDLSIYDHYFNKSDIIKSWGLNGGDSNFTNGYFYPLIDYGYGFYFWQPFSIIKNPIRYDSLRPAVYTKIIFDKIFSEAGYTYTSNFLNSDNFKNLILPFADGNLKPSFSTTLGSDGVLFAANRGVTYSLVNSSIEPVGSPLQGRIYFSSLKCNTDIFDPNSVYDTINHNFTNIDAAKIKFGIKFTFIVENQFTITNLNGRFWWDTTDDIIIWCKRSYKSDGTPNPFWNDNPNYASLAGDVNAAGYFDDITFGGNRGISIRNIVQPSNSLNIEEIIPSKVFRISGLVETDYLEQNPLRSGEEVRFFVTRRQLRIFELNTPIDNKLYIDIGTEVYAIIDTNTIVQNSLISLKNVVPTKIKQKEFLTSIFKMFNLYIEPSLEINNHFIIEPRDNYYRDYCIAKDWSDKIDLSTEIQSVIISNLQKKTNIFSYKDDKDFYNEKYSSTTNETFGQFLYELENDFLSDKNEIKPIFSPTPIDRLPSAQIFPRIADIFLPIIAKLNNGNFTTIDGMNPRILYRRILNTQTPYYIYDVETDTNDLYEFYPYAGPADDPINPNFTLNFGQVNNFYSGYNETQRNLFNLYYRNQIIELNNIDNRLITCKMDLSYFDINTFRFSDLIFLTINNMSGWFRVVKIVDYDPLADTTTKVELIKAYNYRLPEIWSGSTQSTPQQFCNLKISKNFSVGFYADLLLAFIKNFVGTPYKYLLFYLKEVAFESGNIPTTILSYPTPISNDLTLEDIQNYFNTNPYPGFGFSFANDSWNYDWKITVPCGLTRYETSIVVSTATNSLNDYFLIVGEGQGIDCPCDDYFLGSPQQPLGSRNQIPQDNVYIGVLNTNATNRSYSPNVLMVGSDNIISSSNNISIGDSNASSGNNNIVLGISNESTNNQSLTIGEQNITNAKNSLSIGSLNKINSPQSFVLGYGNISNNIQRDLVQYEILGTSSLQGTYSTSITQSLFVVGNENITESTSGFVYGSNNLIGLSSSNSVIFGNDNNIGYTASGLSVSNPFLNNVYLFGNNNIINPLGSQSLDGLYLFGNNITLTQSTTSSLFYIGSDTIEINTNTFITNVIGTSSFNKIVTADLTIQDDINFNPRFTYRQDSINYPNGSFLFLESVGGGLNFVYEDLDGGDLQLVRKGSNNIDNKLIFSSAGQISQEITTTYSITESIQTTNSQIFKVNNQISHKILGEELDLANTTKNIYLSDFYYDYMDFFTYSTLDIDITVRYNSGTAVGFDYLSQRAWYDGNGMSVFTATGSRISYNNLTSPNDVQSYIDQYSSIIWGNDEPALIFYTNFGFTASFYYEINLKYNGI